MTSFSASSDPIQSFMAEKDYFTTNQAKKELIERARWRNASRNPAIDWGFVERHLDKIDWTGISNNPSLPIDFIERHVDKIDWITLAERIDIPLDFLESHILDLLRTAVCMPSRGPAVLKRFYARLARSDAR
jgi:hypothetical protein